MEHGKSAREETGIEESKIKGRQRSEVKWKSRASG